MAKKKKSDPDLSLTPQKIRDNEITRSLDLMERTTEERRSDILGKNWVSTSENFYNLIDGLSPSPAFRPRVTIPELQLQMLCEASDITDISPIPYIVRPDKNSRDKDREKAFQAEWRQKNFNLEWFKAWIWALFTGSGYIQLGFDPYANMGSGSVWARSRHPGTVFPDPYATCDEELQWVILKDWRYIDEVRQMFPERGWEIGPLRSGAPSSSDTQLRLPQGPMSATGGMLGMGGADTSKSISLSDNRVCVRTAYVNDYSALVRREDDEDEETTVLLEPRAVPAYPDGRLLVECNGVALLDRANPFAEKPIVSVWGMPPLAGFFPPPPVRYTKDLQDLAQKLYTQTYENAVRLNNGQTYIDEGTGIDIEDYGGVPAEVHQIADNSRIPETKWPQQMPAHMTELPKILLEKAKDLQGFSPARKGIPGAGNISAPLFDASLLQSQSLTRMRSRLGAPAFQRMARIAFGMMGRFYTSKRGFPSFHEEAAESVSWTPIKDFSPENYLIMLDENSIQPFSQIAMRMIVPMLRQLGAIDQRTTLELLNIPNMDEIMERLKAEAAQRQQAEQSKEASKNAAKVKKK